MIAMFDTCMLCGRPVRRTGDRLCTFHDIQFLIALGAQRMRKRVGRKSAVVINKTQKLEINKGA